MFRQCQCGVFYVSHGYLRFLVREILYTLSCRWVTVSYSLFHFSLYYYNSVFRAIWLVHSLRPMSFIQLLQSEWMMHRLSKNKMVGVNSCFPKSLWIRNSENDPVPENTNKAMKFGRKVFQVSKRHNGVRLCISFSTCPRQSHIFSSTSGNSTAKSLPFRHWQKRIPQGSSAEVSSAIQREIPCGCARKQSVFTKVLSTNYNPKLNHLFFDEGFPKE